MDFQHDAQRNKYVQVVIDNREYYSIGLMKSFRKIWPTFLYPFKHLNPFGGMLVFLQGYNHKNYKYQKHSDVLERSESSHKIQESLEICNPNWTEMVKKGINLFSHDIGLFPIYFTE